MRTITITATPGDRFRCVALVERRSVHSQIMPVQRWIRRRAASYLPGWMKAPFRARRVGKAGWTANVMPEQLATYRACGINGVVAKPISPSSLIAEISRLATNDDDEVGEAQASA